ncbi:MAG: MBL fold metallo-hydrolase [Actinomycetia bacterium]|nr:MBL fold metallo-hydrolase [Actinomycetes bacterium]MCP4960719.1 MBL fold metallo-hydrolase [Actinomycetes bacterium]
MAPRASSTRPSFEKGLQEVGDGCFAYLQPDGGWGWSNAGLLTSGGESLLVDTLFDLHLTRQMLDEMSRVTNSAPITNLVNTHANGDHCYGNELVVGADIIASNACAQEMSHTPPEMLAQMMAAAPTMGPLGEYLIECFGDFDFEGITPTPPTVTFDQRLDIEVGDTSVHLYEVGPAHTQGDVIAHVPEAGVVYTGDILFIEGTPLMWAGPISNWIAACDLIIDLGASAIVPGHGPLTDADGVGRVKDYLTFVDRETRDRYEAGMTVDEAAADISLGQFADWIDSERVAINVDTIYRELDPTRDSTDIVTLFTMMSKLAI